MGGRKKCIKFHSWSDIIFYGISRLSHTYTYTWRLTFLCSQSCQKMLSTLNCHTQKKFLLILDFSTLFFLPHHHVIPLHENDVSTLIGRRRLEVRSIGNRSFIFMDICHCLCGWHMPNYTSSANTLRHNKSDRYSILEDCQEEAWTTENGE